MKFTATEIKDDPFHSCHLYLTFNLMLQDDTRAFALLLLVQRQNRDGEITNFFIL